MAGLKSALVYNHANDWLFAPPGLFNTTTIYPADMDLPWVQHMWSFVPQLEQALPWYVFALPLMAALAAAASFHAHLAFLMACNVLDAMHALIQGSSSSAVLDSVRGVKSDAAWGGGCLTVQRPRA